MPSFSGVFGMPFNPTVNSDVGRDLFSDFDFGFDALLAQYAPQFMGSTFFDFLSGGGRNLAKQGYQQSQAAHMGAGGNLLDAPTALDFLKNWNPAQAYGSFSPQDRGERPQQAYTPFVRFRT